MPSLSEKQVMRHFNKYKRQFIQELGRKATSDQQLTAVGKRIFGSKYSGTYPQNGKIPQRNGKHYYIINVDLSHQPGSHWVAVCTTPKGISYVYDSFARSSKKLLPHFSKNRIIVDAEYDPEQFGSTEICGPLCLAWLACVDSLGIRNALKI